MRKIISLGTLMVLFALPVLADGTLYGKGVSSENLVKVSELLARPDAYLGQTVRVEGLAVGVCKHRGCWVEIASDKEGETVRVKVQDGEIVFPPELLGSTIAAEGVWTANKLDMDTTLKVCEHQAQEAGEHFDPSTVTECMTLYQITGTGAVVLETARTPEAGSERSGS